MRKLKKRTIIILSGIFLAIITIIIAVLLYRYFDMVAVGKFNLSEYGHTISIYSYEKDIGSIENDKMAKQKEIQLFEEYYGKELTSEYKLIRVKYDCDNDAWLVYSSRFFWHNLIPFFGINEEAPAAIFRGNGEVLALFPRRGDDYEWMNEYEKRIKKD